MCSVRKVTVTKTKNNKTHGVLVLSFIFTFIICISLVHISWQLWTLYNILFFTFICYILGHNSQAKYNLEGLGQRLTGEPGTMLLASSPWCSEGLSPTVGFQCSLLPCQHSLSVQSHASTSVCVLKSHGQPHCLDTRKILPMLTATRSTALTAARQPKLPRK